MKELLRVLPDLGCMRAKREPHPDQVRLGSYDRVNEGHREMMVGNGTHENEDGSTEPDQRLDSCVVERIVHGFRMGVVTSVDTSKTRFLLVYAGDIRDTRVGTSGIPRISHGHKSLTPEQSCGEEQG
jgi:hypothetical protein